MPTAEHCHVCGGPLTNPAGHHCAACGRRLPDEPVIARGLDALQATSAQPSDDFEGATT